MRALLAGLLVLPVSAWAHTDTSSAGITRAAPGGFTAPRILRDSPPQYPAAAKAAGVQGVVVLALDLDTQGNVHEARVHQGLVPALDEAALVAARLLVFAPATLEGVAVPATVRFRYRFVLADAEVPEASAVAGAPVDGVPVDGVRAAQTSTVEQTLGPEAVVPVDVTAQLGPRNASDIRLDVDAIAVAPRAGAGAAELLRRAPGVVLSQHGGEGKAHQIYIRGFDALHGQDVSIRAGGVPVNQVSHVHAQGYADLHFLIPEVVRRLRVVEGAYLAEQGDFAVIGSAEFDLGLSHRGVLGRVSVGQHGLLRGLVAWGPDAMSDETFVAAEVGRTSGFGPGRAASHGSGLAQAELELAPGLRLRLLAGTYAARFGSAGVLRLDDLEAGRVDFFDSYDTLQGGTSQRHQVLGELRHRADGHESRLATYATLTGLTLRQNFTGYSGSPEGDRIEQHNDALTLGLEAHHRRALPLWGRTQHLTLGVELRHDRVDGSQRRLRTVDATPYADELDSAVAATHVGLWGELELRATRWLALTAGLRADLLTFDTLDHLAAGGEGLRRQAGGIDLGPKATLTLSPLDALDLYLSYGRGFRSPQALSLGEGESAPFTTVHAGELGLRWRPLDTLELAAAGFGVFVGDDLVFDHVSGRNLAAGPTRRLGASVLAVSSPLSWLRASLSGALVSAVFTADDERVPYVPPLVVRLDVDARHTVAEPWGAPLVLFGDVGVSAIGPRPLPYSETADPVVTVEAGVGAEYHDVSLSFEAFNLLDARWRDGEFVYPSNFDRPDGASRVPVRHFTAGRPLSLQATLTVKL